MKTIAILGANGRLANEAMQAFHQAGYKVIAVTRNGEVRSCPEAVEKRSADAMDIRQLIEAAQGADFIFNGINPPYTKWAEMALTLSKNILAVAKALEAVHLFPGNVYNYGTSIPAVCDESSPFNGDTKKGLLRVEMERLFAAETEVKTVVLRAGDFYGGTGTGSWFDLVITSKLKQGKFTYPGDLETVHTWAYLPDLAAAFVEIANRTETLPAFSDYLFAGHAMTGREMKSAVEQATNKTLKTATVPWRLLRMMGIIVPMMKEVCEVAYLWDQPHRLDGVRLKALTRSVLNTTPQVAIKQAISQLGLS